MSSFLPLRRRKKGLESELGVGGKDEGQMLRDNLFLTLDVYFMMISTELPNLLRCILNSSSDPRPK